ncbi:hypothetical protein [Candidatus Phytoplasma meliae]|uniref:Uncharacterized protein n=1 Tax=Candidatus Phytoplasma meliae TaxID=1848402 RepID=A0ABS5CYZ9_9MOLU|nr:hypothetical protein [Candidatus Phytoplasma meliae]MBP5835781.1 hypothetical protein [Candidatus Phytoplasma meliae]MBP5836208.1 hypothetical protein [Candidatus Phytoplasma meliae]
MNRIFNLSQIIKQLQIDNSFKIIIFNKKNNNLESPTNYNRGLKILYLNPKLISKLKNMLEEIKQPPFTIKIAPKLDKDYNFDEEQKILFVKESKELQNVNGPLWLQDMKQKWQN